MIFTKPENETWFNFWGEFRSNEYEQTFRTDRWQSTGRQVQLLCALSAFAYFCGIIVDYLDNDMRFTSEFGIMAGMRLAVLLAGISIRRSAARTTQSFDLTWLVSGYMILFGIAEAVSIAVDGRIGLISDGVPFIVVIVLFFYLFSPSRTLAVLTGGLAASAIYIVTMIAANTSSAAQSATVVIFLVCANVFGFNFIVNFGRTQRNEYRALVEERTLNRKLQVEIAERQKAQEMLLVLATIDDLTKVANRRCFINMAARELNRCQRHGAEFCILMLDIDHFKQINDNYGHDVGDMALKEIAAICRET